VTTVFLYFSFMRLFSCCLLLSNLHSIYCPQFFWLAGWSVLHSHQISQKLFVSKLSAVGWWMSDILSVDGCRNNTFNGLRVSLLSQRPCLLCVLYCSVLSFITATNTHFSASGVWYTGAIRARLLLLLILMTRSELRWSWCRCCKSSHWWIQIQCQVAMATVFYLPLYNLCVGKIFLQRYD